MRVPFSQECDETVNEPLFEGIASVNSYKDLLDTGFFFTLRTPMEYSLSTLRHV